MKWENCSKSAPSDDKSWIYKLTVRKMYMEKKTNSQRNNRNLKEDGREMEYKTVPDGKELWVNTRWRERAKHAGPNTSSPDRQT